MTWPASLKFLEEMPLIISGRCPWVVVLDKRQAHCLTVTCGHAQRCCVEAIYVFLSAPE